MNAAKTINSEPIPGYRLIAPLGSGGFGEVWKCEAPGGLLKAIKFVHSDGDDIHPDAAGARQELHALQYVKALRHPFLLSLDRVEFVAGELVIVMELADRSLHDLFGKYRAAGRAGLPRAELLRYFAEAAEVLDLLNQEHGLQHLDVKPRNLFVVGRHVKVADFGLVNSVAEMNGAANCAPMSVATPVYAAPETFLGKITSFSDQYSLAIAYHELLVGAPPFAGKNLRQLAFQHTQIEPDLSRLPEGDRPVVARALAKNPGGRFSSCAAFIEALQTGAQRDLPLTAPSANCQDLSDTRTDIPIALLSSTPRGSDIMPRTQSLAEVVSDKRPELLKADATTRETPTSPPGRPPLPASFGGLLADYQFLECVAHSAFGETWTARADDGRDRLVRFFFGVHCKDDKEEQRLSLLRELRNDALEPMELVGDGDHRLALITDACTATLSSRMRECQGAGLPGVPRPELLAWLGAAAGALDGLLEQYGIRHLTLTPRHFLLKEGRVRLLHFGLAELIPLSAEQRAAVLNPRYAAPELLDGPPHPSSDAYSLAVIYCELLTGVHPFRNAGARQADLGLIPSTDRAVLQRALHIDANRRFRSCGDFMAALDPNANLPTFAPEGTTSPLSDGLGHSPFSGKTRARMRQHINGLVAGAVGDLEVREYRNARYLLRPGHSLEHQFRAQLMPGVADLIVDGFRLQWNAVKVRSSQNQVVLLAPLTGTFWQRLMGIKPGMQIYLDVSQGGGPVSEVRVVIRPVKCRREAATLLLEETAPLLLDSLRAFFHAQPERRSQARLPFDQIVQVTPVSDGRNAGDVVVSRATDISMRGIGIHMPSRPSSQQVNIRLAGDPSDNAALLPASVVRAIPADGGGYEVGFRFLVEEGPQKEV